MKAVDGVILEIRVVEVYNPKFARRGARVVESGSLENCCTLTGTVGSNPTLSATYISRQ